AEELHAEAGRRLKAEIADREKVTALREFRRQRDAALFHGLIAFAGGTLLTGRADTAHWGDACAAAARALALAGDDPAARFGGRARADDMADDCFALLLLTAGGQPEG